MNPISIAFLIGISLSAITVFADMLIKNGSLQNSFTGWHLLILGCIIYGLTGFGWFFVMRHMKLSTLGVLYGVSCVILLTLVSVFYFKEPINSIEIIGVVMAITSLIILSRFA
jgi:drug/metabolite transporter (DMT)-like permease